jgi:hypothetical protein
MDRRLKGDQREHVGRLHAQCAARGAPSLHSGDELAEKLLHRSLGSSRASSPYPLRQLRGDNSNAGSVTRSDKMHDTCPTARLVETHPLAHASHRLAGERSTVLSTLRQCGVHRLRMLSQLLGPATNWDELRLHRFE